MSTSDELLSIAQLDRYLAGIADPEERRLVEVWIAADPLRRIVWEREGQIPSAHACAVLERVLAGKGNAASSSKTGARPSVMPVRAQLSGKGIGKLGTRTVWGGVLPLGRQPLPARLRRWWMAVPVFAGAAGILLLGWSAGLHHFGVRQRPVTYTTYATARGQRANITLPDGNTVMLNVASRLDVPSNYSAGNQALRLSGEALFTVTHHDDAPFTVTAAGETARVLGTSFVMRHYPDDTAAFLAVRDGKVTIRSTVLVAQQMTEIVRGKVSSARNVSPAQFAFVTGTLSISGMTLASAMPELGRWYDVDLRLGDPSLGALYVEGEFAAGAPSDLASILELALHVRVVRDGRTLTLFPR